MAQERIRILIEGNLNNINFRLSTQKQAEALDIVGFVRTLSNGQVEIEAQGEQKSIDALLAWCQQDPHSNLIRSILFRYDELVDRYNNFSVR